MKLSEAILLGSMNRKQAFGDYEKKRFSFFGETRTCALGAALEAVGSDDQDVVWPWANVMLIRCPVCGDAGCVHEAIVCLNDDHHWTRERIAEWVSTIEPADEPADAAVTGEREAEAVENAR